MSTSTDIKKNMLVIWAVASLLWAIFSAYMFKVDQVRYAYSSHAKFTEKIARGQNYDPTRWGYNMRGYKRTAEMVNEANKNLGMFFMIGFGFPGIMLAIGTALLENVGAENTPRKKA